MYLLNVCLVSSLAYRAAANPLIYPLNPRDCLTKPPGDAYLSIPIRPDQTWCGEASDSGGAVTGGRTATQSKVKANTGTLHQFAVQEPPPGSPLSVTSASISVAASAGTGSPGAGSNGGILQLPSSDIQQPGLEDGGKNPVGSSIINTTSTNGAFVAASQGNKGLPPPHVGGLPNNDYIGVKLQAAVSGYNGCLAQKLACSYTGAPGRQPTAAMSQYLLPNNHGVCGSCWRVTNPRTLVNSDDPNVPPWIGAPFRAPFLKQPGGFVVMVNNACADGADQYRNGSVGQCTQFRKGNHPKDKLGSDTVMDICTETDGPMHFWGTTSAGFSVADIEGVSCNEWPGVITRN